MENSTTRAKLMKFRSITILAAVLAGHLGAAPVTTNTYVEFAQMGPSGVPVSRGAVGTSNAWEAWSFDASGILGPKSLSEMFAGSGYQVSSGSIADGTITNDDINGSAAIALSKLATNPLARANHTGTQPLSSISDAGALASLSAVGSAQVTDGSIQLSDLAFEPQLYNAALQALINGSLDFTITLQQGYTVTGQVTSPLSAMVGSSMDVSKNGEIRVLTGNATLSFLGSGIDGRIYKLLLVADGGGPYTVNLPDLYSVPGNVSINQVSVPANGMVYLVLEKQNTQWLVHNDPASVTGTGKLVNQDNPTINGLTVTGAINLPDGVNQTTNPNGTNPGFVIGNHGSLATVPVNGGVMYLSGSGFRFYEEGTWRGLADGAGNVSSTNDFGVTNSVIVSDGTGKNVKKTPVVIDASGNVTGVGNVDVDEATAAEVIAGTLSFEGATVDGTNKWTFTVTDPTGVRSGNLPNIASFGDFLGSTGAQTVSNKDLQTSTATTASPGDNDTSLATTAFVQTEIDGTKSGSHASPSTTNPLSPTWNGVFHAVYYGATGTINLPAASSYDGRGIWIYNTGSFTVTVEPNGTEVIVRDGNVQSAGVNFTLSSGAGNFVSLVSDGTRWITAGYKGTLSVGS